MKIKNLFITAVVIAAFGFSTTSCDYLDVVPPEKASLNNTMDNYKQALGFLHECYKGISHPVAEDWKQGINTSVGQP
ncbi:MAG: RagB/SusD family nutrient uptake outer membrane protein, partial [Muribaculaceae bacterium]|nr:RagB/SusD family nutrient uptake outer membrane protein [Muribaculaceae bacterium]